jgi:hypothetical protein
MIKKLFFLYFITISFNLFAQQKRVLFIGNSYYGVNNLPDLIYNFGLGLGDTIYYEALTPGGFTAQMHWNDAATKTKIMQGNWDYVCIQCQSQEPSFSPAQVELNTFPFIKKLDSLVQATNTCAETMYYMTWGRKNGDAGNCASYPPVCTFEGMNQRLRESYLLFADSTNANVIPVGIAWKNTRDSFPNIELYQADESHPSVAGSYLAAAVFYYSIFQKTSSISPFLPVGVTNSEGFYLQTIAKNTVLDSLENWQGQGNLPFANFDFTQNGNVIQTSNLSKRFATLEWSFGDGNTSTQSQPNHTYLANGTYTITLKVISTCGKISIFKREVLVNTNSFLNEEKNPITFYIKNNIIFFENINDELNIELFNIEGKNILKQQIDATKNQLNVNHFGAGIYFIKIIEKNNAIQTRKIRVE